MDRKSSVFLKKEKCDWADEVEKELQLTGNDDKFSQWSDDTWLYYSTSSSLPSEVASVRSTRKRTTGGHRHKTRPSSSRTKDPRDSAQETPIKPAEPRTGKTNTRATVIAMVQSRRKDFEDCAISHGWASKFNEKEISGLEEAPKVEAPRKQTSKEKERKIVCHQVMDGAVLVVTRKAKTTAAKAPEKTAKKSKKLKKITTALSTTSRCSRADSSNDWKSDKKSSVEVDSPIGYRDTQPIPKRTSRFLIGDTRRHVSRKNKSNK